MGVSGVWVEGARRRFLVMFWGLVLVGDLWGGVGEMGSCGWWYQSVKAGC